MTEVNGAPLSGPKKALGCLGFLTATLVLWILTDNWLVFGLLVVPYCFFGEWLSSKIFSGRSKLSVEESGFSLLRIATGVTMVLLFAVVTYGLFRLGHWLLR